MFVTPKKALAHHSKKVGKGGKKTSCVWGEKASRTISFVGGGKIKKTSANKKKRKRRRSRGPGRLERGERVIASPSSKKKESHRASNALCKRHLKRGGKKRKNSMNWTPLHASLGPLVREQGKKKRKSIRRGKKDLFVLRKDEKNKKKNFAEKTSDAIVKRGEKGKRSQSCLKQPRRKGEKKKRGGEAVETGRGKIPTGTVIAPLTAKEKKRGKKVPVSSHQDIAE